MAFVGNQSVVRQSPNKITILDPHGFDRDCENHINKFGYIVGIINCNVNHKTWKDIKIYKAMAVRHCFMEVKRGFSTYKRQEIHVQGGET